MKTLKLWIVMAGVLLLGGGVAEAAPTVAVLDVQKVVAQSNAGKAAHNILEGKMKELQGRFKGEEDALLAMQQEIEKKSSVWSDAVKEEKAREFQKKRRELQAKSEDARFELKKLQDHELEPILKELKALVEQMGKSKGYGLVLDVRVGVLYHDAAVDITDEVTSALNARSVSPASTPAKAPAKAPAKK